MNRNMCLSYPATPPPPPHTIILISPPFSWVLLYPTTEVLGIIPPGRGLVQKRFCADRNVRLWILRWEGADKALSGGFLRADQCFCNYTSALSASIFSARSDRSLPPWSRPVCSPGDLNSSDLFAFLLSSLQINARIYFSNG